MRRRGAIAAGMIVAAGLAAGGAVASFTATTSSSGNGFAAAPDLVAPTASAIALGKTEGGEAGAVRAGGTFRAYANVSDTGNPASGTASVGGDLGGLSFSLPGGSTSFGGQTYTHASGTTTAPAGLAEGNRTLAITMTDAAGNTATQNQTVTVDNTAPAGTDVQTRNNGAVAGSPELGDTITYSFTEGIDRQSAIPGWTAATDPQNVVVRIDYGLVGLSYDTLTVYNAANTAQLTALGSVRLNNGLLSVPTQRTFGASGTPSKLVRSGSDLTITLGTPNVAALSRPAVTMQWTPSSAAFDRAGNPCSTTAVNEGGALDAEF